ncbi:MAG TPA: glyoxalase [Flavobacteriaceae bacterium]|nr:glyoxalase [Flavobacteriaceae bacterium]
MNDKTKIEQVGTVFVPVRNQDKALDFYTNKLGFEKCVDAFYSDGKRWIEVAPPNSGINLALVSYDEGKPTTDDRTICAFSTNDIEADYETLQKNNVDIVDEKIGKKGLFSTNVSVESPMPPQFSFRDPDGNRFLIVEP